MSLATLEIETITPDSFAPFGTVVDWTPSLEASGRPFHILVRSEAPTGWRMAMLKVTNRATQRLENHPQTEELFAPVTGRGVLLVAGPGPFREEGVHAFLLDRPVSVGPGVWHGNLTLSDWSTILIAENLEVTGEYAPLSRPVGATLGQDHST
jgi:ureidoglycolate hydrolase